MFLTKKTLSTHVFPSPTSTAPVGTFHPNDEISAAKDKSHDLTGSVISAPLSDSTIGKCDRTQKTVSENYIKRLGWVSTEMSIHDMRMHFHSLQSLEDILLYAVN